MGASERRNVTREDVARLAGVSTAVVSYVVNNGPRPVADQTRQRVQWAIDQLGFRPNARARALSLGSTFTYGVMVPNVQNIFHAAVVQALEDALAARELSMLLAHSRGAGRIEAQTLDDMIARGVDGIISLMTHTSGVEWVSRKIPVPVALLDRYDPLPGFITICPDFEEGGMLATRHLLEHGVKTILPVFGALNSGDPNLRLRGYELEMERAQLPKLESIETEWSLAGGYRAAEIMLARGDLPEGVFCFSDVIAVGFLSALSLRGIRAPDDIKVVCFDGTDAAKYASPPLTSVTQPVAEMAESAVEGVLRPRPAGVDHRQFPVHLVTRASCGCAPAPGDTSQT